MPRATLREKRGVSLLPKVRKWVEKRAKNQKVSFSRAVETLALDKMAEEQSGNTGKEA